MVHHPAFWGIDVLVLVGKTIMQGTYYGTRPYDSPAGLLQVLTTEDADTISQT